MEIRNEFVKRISEINSFYEILRIIEFEKPKIFGFNIDENKIENLIIKKLSGKQINDAKKYIKVLKMNL